MQIQKLEDFLGVTIFDRSSKPVKATPIGKEIIKQAKITLSSSDKIEELVNEQNKTVKGDFVLALIPTVSPFLLPLFIKDLLSNNPELNLIVKEKTTDQIIAGLKTGEIDGAILATPLLESTIEETALFNDEMKIYTAKSGKDFLDSLPTIGDLPTERLLLERGKLFKNTNSKHINSSQVNPIRALILRVETCKH